MDQNGIIYDSINDAANRLSLHAGSVSNVVNGRCKTAGGYTFTKVEV